MSSPNSLFDFLLGKAYLSFLILKYLHKKSVRLVRPNKFLQLIPLASTVTNGRFLQAPVPNDILSQWHSIIAIKRVSYSSVSLSVSVTLIPQVRTFNQEFRLYVLLPFDLCLSQHRVLESLLPGYAYLQTDISRDIDKDGLHTSYLDHKIFSWI